ncbi:hypothetical protein TRFO_06168 [Tritrichomonas foetus]|uniref:Importin N-terminal domain-containing protein n=1 Tax=Tritrichomonas foetus TaxID=1144522 RepID=A0A1J4JZZ4_9EUKA|nr:hypothetical protein TRFO_06168 [Tritrichomonas foetus]|eukprot:OHT04737.1 hypothetical protein TRFO_06168 [Tritrichomonas foetus]
MNRVEHLLSLYQAALHPETVNAATEELVNIYNDPDTIFDHIFLIHNCENLIVRKYVIIKLPQLVKGHLPNIPPEKVVLIPDSIFQLIPNEQDLSCRYFLCDVIASFLSKAQDFEILESSNIWPTVFSFCNEFIQTPQLLSTGLYLWQNIYVLFPMCDSPEVVFSLLNVVTSSLSSEKVDDRIQSLKLFGVLREFLPSKLSSENELNSITSLLTSLYEEMKASIYQRPNPEELNVMVSEIGNLIENGIDFLEFQHISGFFEMTVAAISDKNIPLEIRYLLNPIFDNSFELIFSDFQDKLPNFIQLLIDLSLEMCNSQRDDFNYEFPLPFFREVCDACFDEAGTIFSLFMDFAFSLAQNNDLPSRQVALFLVKSIIEGNQEIMGEKICEIIHFILSVGDVNDSFVFQSACRTIDELIEFASQPLSQFINEITTFLTKYIHFPESLQTLDSLFYQCDRAPNNIDEIFKGLISLIDKTNNSYQIEQLLSCISSLFNHLSNSDESIFSIFLPILNQLRTKNELRGPILEFFGHLVKVAPITLKSELNNIIDYGVDSFSPNNFILNRSASLCFKSIAEKLPISFMPFLPHVVPPLVAILQQKSDNIPSYLISDFSKAQKAAMITLSTFVGFIPQGMIEYAQSPILDFIIQPKGGLAKYLVDACESIAYASEGYKVIGVPLFEIIDHVIPSPLLECKIDHAFSILMMLSEIIATFGEIIPDELMNKTIVAMIQILNSPPQNFLMTDHSSCIDNQLQRPLFYLLSQILDTTKEKFLPFVDNFCNIIAVHFNSKSLLMKCNSLFISAQLCYTCHITNTFFQMVVNMSVQILMSTSNNDARLLIAKALKCLIMTDKDKMQNRIDIILPFSIEMIKSCNYSGLWCTIMMFYDQISLQSTNMEILQHVIELFPSPADSENIVFESEFVVFLKKKHINIIDSKIPMVAAAIFSSSDKHFNSTNTETKTLLANTLSQIPEQSLYSLINGDESKLMRIQSHMQIITES